MKRKISFLLVAVLLLATLIPALPAFAVDPKPSAAPEEDENGTFRYADENPTISTAKDFIAFFYAANKGGNAVYYLGKTVTLLNDITFNDTSVNEWYKQENATKLGWATIGNQWGDNWSWFSGTFDGQGHTLKGVIVEGSIRAGQAGLFPATRFATIKNLNVDGFYVCNTEETYGWNDRGGFGTGGLVGYAAKDLTVENCSLKNGIVTSAKENMGAIGALVGVYEAMDGGSNFTVKITDTTVTDVTVENKCAQIGGIIGHVSNRYNTCVTFNLSGSTFRPADSVDNIKPIGVLAFYDPTGKGDVVFTNSANGCEETFVMRAGQTSAYGDGNSYTDFTSEGNKAVLSLGCYGADANPMVKIKGVQPATDGSNDLRFVGLIKQGDLTAITDLGFILTANGVTVGADKIRCTKVYTSIKAAGETETAPEGYYYFTFVVTDVTEGTEFTVIATATVNEKVCTTTAGSYTHTRAAS